MCNKIKHLFPLNSFIHFLCLLGLSVSLIHCSLFAKKEYLSANLQYFFDDLHGKNLSQCKRILNPWMKQIKHNLSQRLQWAGGENKEMDYLVEKALTIALSKPPHDSTVSKLIQWIQLESQSQSNLLQILYEISRKASFEIMNKKRSSLEKATYYYILENVITEIRSLRKVNGARIILNLISDSDISIIPTIHQERYMKALETHITSPSDLAKQILAQWNKQNEEKQL